jgi:hypothetical protein
MLYSLKPGAIATEFSAVARPSVSVTVCVTLDPTAVAGNAVLAAAMPFPCTGFPVAPRSDVLCVMN